MTSPFAGPGEQFAWDSTSLGLLKECPRKYRYFMIDNLQVRRNHISPHLFFGLHYQKCLETYDRLIARSVSKEDALREVTHLALKLTWINREEDGTGGAAWESDIPEKTRYTLVRSVVWHILNYDPDPAETIILKDGTPAVELNFKLEVGQGLLFCGHLDRGVIFGGDRYVLDHKTTKSALDAKYFGNFRPDVQMSMYTFAGQIVFDSPISGVFIDGAQVLVGFTRFQRGFTHRTEAELNEWVQESFIQIEQSWDYARRGIYPQNDTACDKYGGCVFRRICSASPEVRGHLLKHDFEVRPEPWNPLIPRTE